MTRRESCLKLDFFVFIANKHWDTTLFGIERHNGRKKKSIYLFCSLSGGASVLVSSFVRMLKASARQIIRVVIRNRTLVIHSLYNNFSAVVVV